MNKVRTKYTLLRVSGRFIRLLSESLKQWKLFLFYAGILTVLTAVFKQWSYSCSGAGEEFWCYSLSNAWSVIFLLVGFLLLASWAYLSFIYDFYNQAYKNSVFKMNNILSANREKLKCFGAVLLFILCFIGSMAIGVLILKKPANPNWRIEFIFFVILFATAMIPILAMRFSAAVAYFLQDCHFPNWKKLYVNTKERSYIGVILFLFILLLSVALLMHGQIYLQRLTFDVKILTVALFAEYCGYLIKLFCVVAFLAFLRAQYELMEENNNSEIDAAVTEAPAQEKEYKEKKSRKNKKQKKSR